MAALCLPVFGCSKLSDVGRQTEPAIQTIASAIGQPYTTDSSGNLNTTVRAGADVLLSGENSQKGATDTGAPLISFKWEQIDPGTTPVQLIYRTSNTVSFLAPQVSQDTTLKFKLTVADGEGRSGSTEADVLVKPFRDVDHFLQYLDVPGTFPVVVGTDAKVAADPAAGATAQVPVSVTMTKLVSFTDRNGITHSRVALSGPVTVNTGWTARLGSGGNGCAAPENPTVNLPVPRVNLDDVLADAAGAFPAGTVLSDAMELADVGTVQLEVRLDAASAAATPLLCVNGATTAAASGAIVDAASLLGNASPRDSATSAQAYYNTIDPTGSKTTLAGWLEANGFDSTVKGWNADAHAVYTNNFDLGFGRDMYMKQGACDSGAGALPLDERRGKCNVAAVVVNYAGIEAAAKALNPIVAVAMEYSAAPGGAQRFVKFYTYAFDSRSGGFARVLSVNLDRRGEEDMPQACTVCHGGAPGTVDQTTGLYSNGGDVNAAFLSWDLDSLLYSDTDPGFSSKSRDAALRAQFTRANQEAEFKKLNEGAYLTMADPPGAAGRYALVRELLEGWYGGAGLPKASFDGSFVPQGWKPEGPDGTANTADDNPADSATVYSDVFARNCRACHDAQVPVAGTDPRTATVNVSGVGPLPACSNDARLGNTSVGVTYQVPMGCYWEFAHAPDLTDRLSRNVMPFARRTSDRMWVSADGQSAGDLLRAHLLAAQGTTVDEPGTPYACIDTLGNVTRGKWLGLTSTCSRFLDGAHWTLSPPAASAAALVGADTASTRFLPDVQGDYTVTLSDAAGASSAQVIASVPVASPVAGDGTASVVLDPSGTGTVDVDVGALASSRDPLASTSIESQNGVSATVVGPTTIRITANSVAGGTVTYHLADVDGDLSGTATITVNVAGSIAANDQTFTFTTNSTANDVDLAALVSRPTGQDITLTVTQPTVHRSRGPGSVSAPDGTGHVKYNAPLGVTSYFNGATIDANSQDQFTYTACFSLQPATCDSGTITVRLEGTRSFPSVQTIMSNNCSAGCHESAQTGANSNYIVGATYADANARHALYCELTTLKSVTGNTGTEPANTPYVDLTTPSSSLLYRKPQNLDGHGGATVGDAASVWDPILQWIDEGAYFTENSNQSCP